MPALDVVNKSKYKFLGLIIAAGVVEAFGGSLFFNNDAVERITDPMGLTIPSEWKVLGGVNSGVIGYHGHFAEYISDSEPLKHLLESAPEEIEIEKITNFYKQYNYLKLEPVSWNIDDGWSGYRLTKRTIPADLIFEVLTKNTDSRWELCCMAYGIDKDVDYSKPEVLNWWIDEQKKEITESVFEKNDATIQQYSLVVTYAPYFSLWRLKDDWIFYGRGHQGHIVADQSTPTEIIEEFIEEFRKMITKDIDDDPIDPFNNTDSENRSAIYTVEYLQAILADKDKWNRGKSQPARR